MNAQMLLEGFLTPERTPELSREEKLIARAKTSRLRIEGDGFGRGGGNDVQIYSWGEGPKVLFVHGWGSRASHFEALICEVEKNGLQAVAFDAPGHGRSDGTLSSAPAFASAIHTVVEKEGAFAAVIAHSLGTMATLIALGKNLTFQKAVLLGSCTSVKQLAIAYARDRGAPKEMIEQMLEVANEFFSPEEITADPSARKLEHISALLMHDPVDSEMPYEHSARLAERWPGATLIATPNVGHRRILRSREIVSKAIEHLLK